MPAWLEIYAGLPEFRLTKRFAPVLSGGGWVASGEGLGLGLRAKSPGVWIGRTDKQTLDRSHEPQGRHMTQPKPLLRTFSRDFLSRSLSSVSFTQRPPPATSSQSLVPRPMPSEAPFTSQRKRDRYPTCFSPCHRRNLLSGHLLVTSAWYILSGPLLRTTSSSCLLPPPAMSFSIQAKQTIPNSVDRNKSSL